MRVDLYFCSSFASIMMTNQGGYLLVKKILIQLTKKLKAAQQLFGVGNLIAYTTKVEDYLGCF